MSIKAIYFDIGGVLIRTVDRAPRAALAARLGITYEALANLVFGDAEHDRQAQLGLITADEQWERVCRAVNWPLADKASLRREFFAGDIPDTELLTYIRSLRPRYRTGIISNALSDVRTTLENEWKMADAFDTIVISAEVHLMKPDLRIYQLAVDRLNVQPAEAIFVDDILENVEGARIAGLQVMQYLSNSQVFEELEGILQEAGRK
jgi:epoxide hydrolase-like predicted phosphatase